MHTCVVLSHRYGVQRSSAPPPVGTLRNRSSDHSRRRAGGGRADDVISCYIFKKHREVDERTTPRRSNYDKFADSRLRATSRQRYLPPRPPPSPQPRPGRRSDGLRQRGYVRSSSMLISARRTGEGRRHHGPADSCQLGTFRAGPSRHCDRASVGALACIATETLCVLDDRSHARLRCPDPVRIRIILAWIRIIIRIIMPNMP